MIKIFPAIDFDVLTKEDDDYAIAHGAGSADHRGGSLGEDWWYYSILQATPGWDYIYILMRGFLLFDTSEINGRNIQSASLFLRHVFGESEYDTGQATLHIVQGVQQTPLILSDYGAHLNKVTSGGSITDAEIAAVLNDFIEIPLNSIGLGWINKTGMTKLCLRVAGDINNTVPTGCNGNVYGSTDGWYENPPYPEWFPYLSVTLSSPRRTKPVQDIITLQAIRNIEVTTGGRVFIDEEGKFHYDSRYGRFL